ncbi:uncharacterized protein DUF3124 [Ulvibacter sp. MAR_2010_11]|uniref:DUF3124 domain-containing protein n=1 Tax=Ulvibacter sp. MAR_2010_11 TaxID=1250229 RepID=UPI000CAF2976|nr:DUF3124 domain-containing protein [Ulvibacter sp. MAR_2010_11]PKA83329.1 uncharacterized protein DUF3124 [Ulvibacter sp. MAR_2010_11]
MNYLVILICVLGFMGCENPVVVRQQIPPPNNWAERAAVTTIHDSLLEKGSTYLPVYSEIYQRNQNFTFDLTATVSIRNISLKDTVYLSKADYYNTHGELIRSYFDKPVFVKPMETIEIVVNEDDKAGGTGANFVFDWAVKKNSLIPFFEAVMISTTGQQGLSFTTQGIRKK